MKVLKESGGYRKHQSSNRLYVDAIFGFFAVVSNFTIHIIVQLILGRTHVVRGNPW
jgi:hypothetical protein